MSTSPDGSERDRDATQAVPPDLPAAAATQPVPVTPAPGPAGGTTTSPLPPASGDGRAGGTEEPTVTIPAAAPGRPAGQGPGGAVPATEVIPTGGREAPWGTTSPAHRAPDAYSAPDPYPAPAAGPDVFPESEYSLPPSRSGAHWWGVLLAFVLAPVSWFLLTDGSARLFWSMLADPSAVNIAGYLSFSAGLLALAAVLLAARWSSVGPIITGSISAIVGLTFLVFPERTLETLARYQQDVEDLGGFGRNLYAYTVESGMRGTFVIGGVVLLGAGVISHGARRKGRREEKARLNVRAARGENPFG